jgi:Spx/MgsR family transcriptional regulator
MTTTVYGIPNCDSVKKATKWLDGHGISYQFVDFRKNPVETRKISYWLDHVGGDALINRRSTTWKALGDAEKERLLSEDAVTTLADHITIIKRPVLEHQDTILVGFSDDNYTRTFKG